MEIIAEIGQNHNGDMKLASELIHAAKDNGADVAKFQVFEARALFPKEGNPWYDYNCSTELKREQVELLKDECDKAGIEFGASVFDVERVGWLEAIGLPRYKVASRSVENHALIDAISATGKPMIVSLGMWKGSGFPDMKSRGGVQFLYCVSKYPTLPSDLHLSAVSFDRYAGFSDHTIGLTAAQAAFSRGAKIVEKHFTLDKTMYGPDHEGSMTPNELKALSRFRDELQACF